MNMNIKVNLTFEQVRGLVALGMTEFEEKLQEYYYVEDKVRSKIDNIIGYIDYMYNNQNLDNLMFLKSLIKDCKILFEDNLVDTYYWKDNFSQKEILISIFDKANFLIDNMEEYNKRNLNYFEIMNDDAKKFVIELNK